MSADFWLSPREIEVCALVASGESDGWIAKELEIGSRTVQTHMSAAAAKIHRANPHLKGSARKIIHGYYVMYAGMIAFEIRRRARAA